MSRQDLDGDVAIELHLAREVDHAHAATTELALDRILTGEGGLQGEEIGGRMGHDMVITRRSKEVEVASARTPRTRPTPSWETRNSPAWTASRSGLSRAITFK